MVIYTIFILFLCVIGSLGIVPKLNKITEKKGVEWGSYIFAIILFVFSVIDLSASTFNPFIYFQF